MRPITPLQDVKLWYRKLIAAPQGVIYEDDYFQLGVRQVRPSPQLTLNCNYRRHPAIDRSSVRWQSAYLNR